MNMIRGNELGFIEIAGICNLPPGFRFVPTDQEAFEEYVLPRINGEEKYQGLFNTVDIYEYEPRDLPGFNMIEPSFYFTPRDPLRANGSRIKRTIKSTNGFWRSNNKVNLVKDSDGVVLGRKNSLVYILKNEKGITTKTDYLMVEYVLDDSRCKSDKLNNVVLCKIYHKKLSKAQEELRLNEGEKGKQQFDESLNPNDDQASNKEQLYGQQSKVPLDDQDNYNSSYLPSIHENDCEFKRKHEESIPPNQEKVFEAQTSKRPLFVFNNQCINVNVPTALEKTEVEGTGSSFTVNAQKNPEN